MLKLPNVTLVAVSSVDLEGTDLALRISSNDIEFGAIKFLCSEIWSPSDSKIEMVDIPKLNFVGYSQFVLNSLFNYVETDFCLLVQADGFVLNASRWKADFLKYDFIGAPWPVDFEFGSGRLNLSRNNVGNGGFSLRSKKLLYQTARIDFDSLQFPTKSEDLIICHFLYDDMITAGIKFPRPELAAQFSIESQLASYGQSPKSSFGFHGKALRDLILSGIQK